MKEKKPLCLNLPVEEIQLAELGKQVAMALSQSLEDSPFRLAPRHPSADGVNPQEVYNERHRLALEELLSGGLEEFLAFLRRERIPNFLSDGEIQRIRSATVSPQAASLPGEDPDQQSVCGSLDCSSVTYFPEVSDVEPPLLEIGWPAFTAGSYRGVTRAVAHFQPSYGETIYSCKEAARRMIKSAKEVIAIVTDSLTDLDIFKDLQEASSLRKVPVYVLLDKSCAPAFLKMCRNVGVRLEDLRQMRVRTITGTTYYMRSGARITGKVHERFMLVDGNRVATGSYRFNWTDGKLNSSNLIELSGQITEKFDEEFRVLYAQSSPISTRGPPSSCVSSIYEQLAIKQPATRERPVEPACLTSTPSRRPQTSAYNQPTSPVLHKTSPVSDSSTVEENWAGQEEILAGSAAEKKACGVALCHASTQTACSVTDSDTQTEQDRVQDTSPSAHTATDPSLQDCFQKLAKERLYHYSAIRSKLEHMVSTLSARRELADVTNMAPGLAARSRLRIHKDCVQEPNPGLPVESVAMGTWPRARCVH